MANEEFTVLVRMMRNAQKNYFQTRSKLYLNESMKLEKQVDSELAVMAGEKLL